MTKAAKVSPTPKRYRVVRAIHYRPAPDAPEMVLRPGQVFAASALPASVLGELASGALEEIA